MRPFLERLSSRKFLTALAVQVAAVAALFWPDQASALSDGAVRIAALVTLLLAALGYARIEAGVDAGNATDESTDPASESEDSPADPDATS